MVSLSGNIDARAFRNCCGLFATGITIVTTELDGITHGMTANGFMSVSLNPPLILVSIGSQTKLHQYLAQTMRYGVSVLEESQVMLSNHFAGRPKEGLEVPFQRVHDVPLIDGAVAHIIARVVDAHPAGDHTLYIGEVEHLSYSAGRPLLYFAGSYNNLRPDLKPDHASWMDNEVFFYPKEGKT
jgi:flavin reductase (DIM6/NTAB) family NADH-FMN oxidoreductase RutF